MSHKFACSIQRIRFDEHYTPANNTRLTTNFANLARGDQLHACGQHEHGGHCLQRPSAVGRHGEEHDCALCDGDEGDGRPQLLQRAGCVQESGEGQVPADVEGGELHRQGR